MSNRPRLPVGRLALPLAALWCMGCSNSTPGFSADRLAKISLPPGFTITLFADSVPHARSMVQSPGGIVFVGNREGDHVYALPDRDGNGRADTVYRIGSGLNTPNGVAFRDGALYVAEISRILRFDDVERQLDAPPEPMIVNDSFPSDRWHGWKYIAFGPDGKLYVPVGAPCNVCERTDERYASILRMKADGSDLEVFAHGVRNTVGFDWHPATGDLWFTDNGRDYLGDDRPPDELNHAATPGLHFGFPYFHGGDIPDPEYAGGHIAQEFVPPVQKLGPHVAALGMCFYTGTMFPEEYVGRIFIAEHGSWNRSTPIGYRLTTVSLRGEESVGYDVFADGWLEDAAAWGRPVDVIQASDGSLLVSDDKAGVIYRISYGE
jgi:glucose/arabinose dehydrogenase